MKIYISKVLFSIFCFLTIISSEFILPLSAEDKWHETLIDKDYKGSFSIPDLYEFDDIYKVQIIVDTERINPFRLNHFKRLD